MKLLPVALNVAGLRCLIVGGGPVAARKAAALLECEALVTAIAPRLDATFDLLAGRVRHEARNFAAGDCSGNALVFACTDDADVNRSVHREARLAGIWCNVADDAPESDFHSLGVVWRGEICVGIGTGSGSPALARHLTRTIESIIGPEYEALLEIVAARRGLLERDASSQSERAAMWKEIVNGGMLDLLREGRRVEAETRVDSIIGEALARKRL